MKLNICCGPRGDKVCCHNTYDDKKDKPQGNNIETQTSDQLNNTFLETDLSQSYVWTNPIREDTKAAYTPSYTGRDVGAPSAMFKPSVPSQQSAARQPSVKPSTSRHPSSYRQTSDQLNNTFLGNDLSQSYVWTNPIREDTKAAYTPSYTGREEPPGYHPGTPPEAYLPFENVESQVFTNFIVHRPTAIDVGAPSEMFKPSVSSQQSAARQPSVKPSTSRHPSAYHQPSVQPSSSRHPSPSGFNLIHYKTQTFGKSENEPSTHNKSTMNVKPTTHNKSTMNVKPTTHNKSTMNVKPTHKQSTNQDKPRTNQHKTPSKKKSSIAKEDEGPFNYETEIIQVPSRAPSNIVQRMNRISTPLKDKPTQLLQCHQVNEVYNYDNEIQPERKKKKEKVSVPNDMDMRDTELYLQAKRGKKTNPSTTNQGFKMLMNLVIPTSLFIAVKDFWLDLVPQIMFLNVILHLAVSLIRMLIGFVGIMLDILLVNVLKLRTRDVSLQTEGNSYTKEIEGKQDEGKTKDGKGEGEGKNEGNEKDDDDDDDDDDAINDDCKIIDSHRPRSLQNDYVSFEAINKNEHTKNIRYLYNSKAGQNIDFLDDDNNQTQYVYNTENGLNQSRRDKEQHRLVKAKRILESLHKCNPYSNAHQSTSTMMPVLDFQGRSESNPTQTPQFQISSHIIQQENGVTQRTFENTSVGKPKPVLHKNAHMYFHNDEAPDQHNNVFPNKPPILYNPNRSYVPRDVTRVAPRRHVPCDTPAGIKHGIPRDISPDIPCDIPCDVPRDVQGDIQSDVTRTALASDLFNITLPYENNENLFYLIPASRLKQCASHAELTTDARFSEREPSQKDNLNLDSYMNDDSVKRVGQPEYIDERQNMYMQNEDNSDEFEDDMDIFTSPGSGIFAVESCGSGSNFVHGEETTV